MASDPQGRLRIAINAAFWGQETAGSGQYLHHLVDALATMENGPEIALCGPPELRASRPLPKGVTWQDAPVPGAIGANSNPGKVWFEQVAFPRAARAVAASAAHVPYFASPLAPGVPTLVTVHDLIPLLLPAYRTSALVRTYMAMVARSARRAALVLTDAQATCEDIVRHLGVLAHRVRAIPLATAPIYRPVENREALAALRAQHNLPADYLLYLGGFDQRRNLGTLFRALAAARRAEPGLPPLVLAGVLPAADTVLTPDPRRLAAEAGLSEGLHFLGRVDEGDKPALYSGALAFLFPSRYEGFGLTVLEALACGTPVICANATSLPEVGGPGALLVEADDVAGWAQAIVQIVGNPDLRSRLRAAGLAHAAGFSWARTASETLLAYQEIARGKAARSQAGGHSPQ